MIQEPFRGLSKEFLVCLTAWMMGITPKNINEERMKAGRRDGGQVWTVSVSCGRKGQQAPVQQQWRLEHSGNSSLTEGPLHTSL